MNARTAHLVTTALVATAVAFAAPALAQSKRHPPPPVDKEAEAEARSDFWEEVVRPGARRYQQLVDAAIEILRVRAGDWKRARELMLEATALRPDLVAGWAYLGVASERLATAAGARPTDWKVCAEAYGKAYAIDPTWLPSALQSRSDPSATARAAGTRPLELGWATCLARSGDIERATLALEALVARGQTTGESWLRLGEVYMAAGRLGEAITAFEQARNERIGQRRARWLLAIAYDRARRPGEADAIAADAGDIGTVTGVSEPLSYVPAHDTWYLQAFGWRHRPGRALALFRTFLAKAPPEDPWRARAQEHIDALVDVDFAAHVDVQGSGDRAAIEKAVRAAMPSLRACVAPVPEVYVELRITQMGPVKALPPPKPVKPAKPATPTRPAPVVKRGHYRPPGPVVLAPRTPTLLQPGVHAEPMVWEPGVADSARNQALECLEKLGLSLSLPRPPANTYAVVRIPVVAGE